MLGWNGEWFSVYVRRKRGVRVCEVAEDRYHVVVK